MTSTSLWSALLLLLPVACKTPDTGKHAPPRVAATSVEPSRSANPPSLSRVTDLSSVCMVNNQYMGTPQIPIEVDGRTYYGCCEMCKGKLASDASARTAIDLVSGKPVDKATAVIGRDAIGKVVYFESEQTFEAYVARGASDTTSRQNL